MDHRDELENWQKKWEENQHLFPKKKEEIPFAKNTTDSFYGGLSERKEKIDPKDIDSKYWDKVKELVLEGDDGTSILVETAVQDVAKVMASSPNPVHPNTTGNDDSLEPRGTGATYTDEDLNELNEMKIKLHELQGKLLTAETKGDDVAKFEKQLNDLKEKIDEFSTMLGQEFPHGKVGERE